MDIRDEEAPTSCALCSAELAEDRLWVEVERERARESGGVHFDVQDFGFCSAEHAGQWFTDGKLPEVEVYEPNPRTVGDRLFDCVMVAVLLGILLTFVAGVVTVIRWLIS